MHGADNKLETFIEPLEPDGYSDASAPVVRGRVQGDDEDRFVLTADGSLLTGDGTASPTDLTSSGQPYVWVPSGDFVLPATGLWPPRTKSAVIAGGSAGDLTVTDVKAIDRLHSVVRLNRDGTASNINISDLTSEFSITGANTINNTGGTDTTGDSLLVQWSGGYDLTGMAFDGTVDEKTGVSLMVPGSWPSVDIYVLGLVGDFSTKVIRFFHSETQANAVDLTFVSGGTGLLASDVEFSSTAGGAGALPLQFKNFSFTREASHANDTGNGIDFCVLGLILVPGS